MNKYTLIFKDKNIEKNYQDQKTYGQNIIIGGLTISFLLRCILKIINFDWVNTGVNLGVVIVLLVLRCYSKYYFCKRLSLIIANCGLSILTFMYEEPLNNYYSHLRGGNSAFTSLIIVFSGDFPEAVFQIIFIQLAKGTFTILYSTQNEYEVLSGSVLVMIIMIYYLYFHHKAIRSQYLLTLVEQKWENVLESIIENQSYFILTFISETYQFKLASQRNCEQYFYNQDYKQFLRESQIEKSTLEHYFFEQIQLHQSNGNPTNSSIIFIKNQLSLFKLKYSIYFANQPTILIIFEPVQQSKNINLHLLYNKIILYSRILQRVITNNNNNVNFSKLQKLQRFLRLESLLYRIEKGKYAVNSINLKKFLEKFDLIQDSNFDVLYHEIELKTIPCILGALILIIQNYSKAAIKVANQNKTISFRFYQESEQTIKLILRGNFNTQKICKLIEEYNVQFLTIINRFQIKNNHSIQITLNRQAYIPFRLTQIEE
ncbi:unnamed protein product (macronuclear) [Paramecium tetraurelia]|uniref:Transmembrane protein n=1 Tax=Paramecium tetraurelia TaxID=5888 RepID=A0BEY7_PARTE|nr:uncharacterized protein GSPATT00028139001 [Paramecium tetraurelia]CAK57104.1 unnamed protein product [Paramecium tetraurelia]|eukprot:XP_001424502.1 hypothetical protein (macronuclear) [Paramecium tetraurelia strain d4-2]